MNNPHLHESLKGFLVVFLCRKTMTVRVRIVTGQLSEENAWPTGTVSSKTPGIYRAEGFFYHTSWWKIVFSYVCVGGTLLFEFILSPQFFVHYIQVLREFSLSLRHH